MSGLPGDQARRQITLDLNCAEATWRRRRMLELRDGPSTDYPRHSMDLPDAIAYCLSKPAAEETTPFGPDALVYKVGGKMFALTDPLGFPPRMTLKCDPERATELRDEFEGVIPGYHMNKRHWNTVTIDSSIPSKLLAEWIDHSYALVVASLPKSKRP